MLEVATQGVMNDTVARDPALDRFLDVEDSEVIKQSKVNNLLIYFYFWSSKGLYTMKQRA